MKPQAWMTAALFVELAALASLAPGIVRADDAQDELREHMREHMHGVHDHGARVMPLPTAAEAEDVSIKLSNKPLSDQDGRSLRLKNDVIGDRIVVVSFVYTNCTTVCPAVSAIFSDLQKKLGSRLDKDVRLVTLSVDPVRDTPSRLKSYAAQYDAKPGWLWLTGTQASVAEALMGFGTYSPNYENHPVVVLIGDGKTGQWSRHYGLSGPDRLLAQVDELVAARKQAGDQTGAIRMASDRRY